jgi:hypothetical protein
VRLEQIKWINSLCIKTTIVNALTFVSAMLYFWFIISLGYYWCTSYASRRKWVSNGLTFWGSLLRLVFRKRIVLLGPPIEAQGRLTVVNANHWHNLDGLILYTLFNGGNGTVSAVSTLNNTSSFDRKVLHMIDAITTEEPFLERAQTKIRGYTEGFLLTFFEGVALNHSTKTWRKYLNRPKCLTFELLAQELPGVVFYDVDLVYTYKNRALNPKDKWFLWRLMSGQTKIYVHTKRCIFPGPAEDPDRFLDDLYDEKWRHIQAILSSSALKAE